MRHTSRQAFHGLAITLSLILALAAPTLAAPEGADPLQIAEAHIRANAAEYRLAPSDIDGWIVTDRYTSAHNGVTHIYFQQQLDGVPVFGATMNVNVAADGRVLYVGNRFTPNVAAVAPGRTPQLSAETAVIEAARHLGIDALRTPKKVAETGGATRAVTFDGIGISRRQINAGLAYLPISEQKVKLVWGLNIEPDQDHYWLMQVDANDGRVHLQQNAVLSDSYKVYELPLESPNHHPTTLPPVDARETVGTPGALGSSPADPAASPQGWNTLSGTDTLQTSGNNVLAYADTTQTDSPDPTGLPTSPTQDFDFPVDLTQNPETYQHALVTNLFYWNNIIHDIFYGYGFDEASGNFQFENFTGDGAGNDMVKAEAQDGSGTNNANMLTLQDGVPPRMQMFIFTPTYNAEVTVDTPAGFGPYGGSAAGFGPPMTSIGTNGDFVLVDDGVAASTTTDACEPITEQDLAGKIAVVDRGSCNFTVKVQNCQNAGAQAVIVINNAPGNPVAMGSANPEPTILIPSMMISLADGNELKTAFPPANPVVSGTVAAASNPPPNRDSDFDNGVITHEYGHGISNRLTGGPGAILPLGGPEQMGEGWSDFFALVLTQDGADEPAVGRGIGTYVAFQDPPAFGGGIRPYPYSTDPAINSQSYEDLTTGELSVPHGVGTVWSSALWDLYWDLVRGVEEPVYGLSLPGLGYRQDLSDFSAPLAGNQVALQLVVDGLKFQPTSPTFVEGRDAILAADVANNGGAYQCYIWHAFAKRGVGVNAIDGDGTLNVTEDPFMPQSCTPAGCFTPPFFAGVETVISDPQSGDCGLRVLWQPGFPRCEDATGVTYTVHRSTDPDFVAGPGNAIATGLTGSEYFDGSVASGVRYYYAVKATDDLGNTELNKVRRSETPAGEPTGSGSFLDDAGDTAPPRFSPAPIPFNSWQVRESGGAVNDTRVYGSNPDGGTYPDDACIPLESETIYLGPSPTLTFNSSYAIEPAWDGGIVEIATAGGNFSDWTKLETVNYPSVMGGAAGDPACSMGFADGAAAFNGHTGPLFLPFNGSLDAYANQAVRIRFLLGSDGGTNDAGWAIDDIGVDDVRIPGTCVSGNDECPDDPEKTEPGICGCGVSDVDSDGDGTADCFDQCPADPNKTDPGACGCGASEADSDGDGFPNCIDECPQDPAKSEAGSCGCGVSDVDSDGDGTADCNDECPDDANKTEPGECGCGVAEGSCSAGPGGGRVKGSGFFRYSGWADDDDSSSGSRNISFKIDAQYKNDGELKGKLKLNDRQADVKIDAKTILTLGPGSGTCNGAATGPNAFEFTASGKYNGVDGAVFRACGEDLAAPGNDDDDSSSDSDSDAEERYPDRLFIECISGCSYATASYTDDDLIDGGNVAVDGPIVAGSGSPVASSQAAPSRSSTGRDGRQVDRAGIRPARAARAAVRTRDVGSDDVVDFAQTNENAGIRLTMTEVVELDSMLLSDAPAGTPLVLTAVATAPDGIDPGGRGITLRWRTVDGVHHKAVGVVDAAGIAAFPITVPPGKTVYHVRLGRLGSNRVVITGY